MENLVVSTSKKFTLEKYSSQIKVVTQNMIKKVLNVSASSVVSGCECTGGAVSLSGKIKLDILYLTPDNIIDKASSEGDFIEKQKFAYELGDTYAFDKIEVSEINFSSNEIICSVTHNTEILGIYGYVLPNFAEEGDNVVLNKNELDVARFVCATEDNFSIAEEIETNLKDVHILNTNANVVLDDVVCSIDKVVVEGRVLAEIIYEDNGNISSMFKQVDFKQEIKADGANPNMKAVAYLAIKNANVSLNESSEKDMLSYNFEIFAKCYIYEAYKYEIASDMFMLTNETKATYDYIELKNHIEMVEQSESVLSQTDITTISDFDDIIGVYEPKVDIVQIENIDEKTSVLAKVTAYALYKTSDGIERLEISEDVRFEILRDLGKLVGDLTAYAQIVSSKVKAGKEIEVMFKINIHANLIETKSAKYIKSYEVGETKSDDDAGIKVYVTRENQTIFEVAKALSVKPELIAAQNEVEDVFESGQKVYVYSPINLV